MKILKDIFFEAGELSAKRVVAMVLMVMAIDNYVSMRTCDEISETQLFLFGEILSGLFLMLGLALGNKHKSFRKSTNSMEESG